MHSLEDHTKIEKFCLHVLLDFFLEVCKYVSIQSKLYEYEGILLPSCQVVHSVFCFEQTSRCTFLCYKMHAVLRTNNTIQAQ